MPASTPAAVAHSATVLTVALIGNPNTGKSTLFNALTGGNARTGNFPGVTVEKKTGRFQHNGQQVQVIDLPGTYSLAPRSADEMVSVDVLLGRQRDLGQPDAVVCIVDASNLERNLYLFSQIRDLGLPVVLILNMWDLAKQSGVKVDLDLLAQRLKVPVVTTSAHRRDGIEAARSAIVSAATQPSVPPLRLFPPEFYKEVAGLGTWLESQGILDTPEFLRERVLLDVHGEAEHRGALRLGDDFTAYLQSTRCKLAEAGCRVPLVETKVRYEWIREQLSGAVTRTQPVSQERSSDRIDRWLTHRVFGLGFFTVLMFLIFQAIYTWAGPAMELVEMGQGWIADTISSSMPPGILRSLLVDGVVAGVGSVLIFLPQIVLLFTFVAILEDCGYMARAAFLMDKLMTKVGLSGKSFLPLMSSFACAIPGVMATRVIENRRDRMVTMLVAPLMSCSARLPVYVLMVGAFIPATTWAGGLIGLQGMVLFLMQALGALVAIPVAWILKKTYFKGETPPFVMELPSYKWPSVRIVASRVIERARSFVTEAGTLIFAVSVLVWAAGYFPGDHSEQQAIQTQIEELSAQATVGHDEQTVDASTPPGTESEAGDPETARRLEELQERSHLVSGDLIRNSFLGRMGRAVEPAFLPLGWDWRIGVGAIASFPAREVIIATLGTIFSLGSDVGAEDATLQSMLQSATWPDGAPLFTIPVALSIMVFFALCAQCGATLMVIRRETNSWRWPAFTFIYMTVLAYVAACLTYQLGTVWLG